ncbi:MAG: hypothetical protein EKK29_05885 [Hyphomicrobiales bacterium]|nr:MAG: hypothetical protein EKK29_05885 [Hyphomicrobiales bacterium]
MVKPERLYLRRKEAGEYLKSAYGFGSGKTLAKLATEGGGPEFFKAGNVALYSYDALDSWAKEKMGAPRRSTAEAA